MKRNEGKSSQLKNLIAIREWKMKDYYKNYDDPIIPEGYKYLKGEWINGFTIQRKRDGSEFVWVPVGYLKANGTINGSIYNEKFGRRNYNNLIYSDLGIHETITHTFSLQIQSVRKYGGYYISRHNISKSPKGYPQSIEGVIPLVNIDFNRAMVIGYNVECSETIKSHLIFGAEYDTILEWFRETKARTDMEIIEDSSDWGNYFNSKNYSNQPAVTGSSEKYCTNGIYDFAGNVAEFTQEENGTHRIVRGGGFNSFGKMAYANKRNSIDVYEQDPAIGMRVALYIR